MTTQEKLDAVQAELDQQFKRREEWLALHDAWRQRTIALKRDRDRLLALLDLERREAELASAYAALGITPPPLRVHADVAVIEPGALDPQRS